ncbi:reverse transcriptase domain-containing protein [Tanacetum coccineum]
MADNRTMEELLQAPTEGYGEAIVIPEINVDHFEIKTNLLQLVQATRFMDVPNDVIKLRMFPYSLEGAARVWYDKEPPNSILTWEDLVTKFVNQFFPPSKTTHLKNEISRFTQKFEETFSEAWERFKKMIRACPHHGFTELTQVDTFYNGLNDNDQDSLNVAAGGNLLSKTAREALNIIENKSKVCYSRNKSNVSRMNMNYRESSSKTDERIDKLADKILTLVEIVSKKVVTLASVKAVEESCVTCGGAHAYYNCPNTDSNQSSVCAATGFQNQPFQVPNNQVQQGVPNEFSNYMKSNDQMMRNMQIQINSLKGEFKNEIQNTMKTQQTVLINQQNAFQNNLQNMLSDFFQNQALTSGTLPSNTIPNRKCEMKAITTRNGVAYKGPSIPTNPSPKKVVERETEETTDKEQTNFQGSTAHIQPPVNPILIPEPDVPKTLPKPNISYPLRLNDQNFREKASNQMEKIFQIFQDLRFDISFVDALLLMPRFAPTIKNLLMNKEKLFELAKIPLNENCSAMLLKKLPEKLGDPGKFLIPCDFPGMDVCHALADLGASINLMPLSIWKKLSLPELTPTWMTLELADRSITRPKGVTEDVFVKVGSFHFPTDFVVVDFEADPRGRDEQLIFHVDSTSKLPQKHANESINMINFINVTREDSFEEELKLKKSNHPSSGSTTPLSDSRPSLTTFETSDSLLEEFADEHALLDPFPPGNKDVDFKADLREIELLLNRDPSTDFLPKITIDPNPERFTDKPALACLPLPGDDDDDKSFLKEDVQEEIFQIYSNPLFEFDDNYNSSDINPLFNDILEDVESEDSNVSNSDEPVLLNTPLFDEDECFDPGGDIIDVFLAIDVPSDIMDAYNDSKGYVLKILYNTTPNLFHEVFFDHDLRSFKDEPDNDDLMTKDKVFDPGIWEKIFSPSIVRLSSKDRHCLSFIIVIQILLTYHVNFLLSSGMRIPFLTPASLLFIFLLLSRWHLKVK